MEDNLARELEIDNNLIDGSLAYQQVEQSAAQPDWEQIPSIQPIPESRPIKKGLTKFEVALISLISIAVFALLLFNVNSDLQLASVSRDVQDVDTEIEQTKVEIENLKQHAFELTRYDRINEIAKKYGLELHEENIINLLPVE